MQPRGLFVDEQLPKFINIRMICFQCFRVFEVIDKNNSAKSASSDSPIAADVTMTAGGSSDTFVDVSSLSFAYPSQPHRMVVQDINLSIKPKTLVALVGKSGSGKSTLLSLLAGLYDTSAGFIRIGALLQSSKHSLQTRRNILKASIINCALFENECI